jgi:hypothetical protein
MLPVVVVVIVYTGIRLISRLSLGQVPGILTEIGVVFLAVSLRIHYLDYAKAASFQILSSYIK